MRRSKPRIKDTGLFMRSYYSVIMKGCWPRVLAEENVSLIFYGALKEHKIYNVDVENWHQISYTNVDVLYRNVRGFRTNAVFYIGGNSTTWYYYFYGEISFRYQSNGVFSWLLDIFFSDRNTLKLLNVV